MNYYSSHNLFTKEILNTQKTMIINYCDNQKYQELLSERNLINTLKFSIRDFKNNERDY